MVMKCGWGPSELTRGKLREIHEKSGDVLPKGVGITIEETFGAKAELEGRHGPLCTEGDVGPGQIGEELDGMDQQRAVLRRRVQTHRHGGECKVQIT